MIELIKAGLIDEKSTHLEINGITEKLKFFVSLPTADSDYYCNLVMLIFGLNKKLFKKDYKNLEFVK